METPHLRHLYRVTAGLADTADPAQVADIIVAEGAEALGATGAVLSLLTEDGDRFHSPALFGDPWDVEGRWRAYPAASATPISDAVRAKAPLILTSTETRPFPYPDLAIKEGGVLAAFPLLGRQRPLGGFALTLPDGQRFQEEERRFLLALSQICALTLDRLRLTRIAEAETDRSQRAQELLQANQRRIFSLQHCASRAHSQAHLLRSQRQNIQNASRRAVEENQVLRLENRILRDQFHALDGLRDLAFRANPLPMWILQARDFAFLEVNAAAVRLYGYSEEEFQRMALRDISAPEDLRRLEAATPRTETPQYSTGQWRHRHKDGSFVWVEGVASTAWRHGGFAIVMSMRDLTRQRRDEENRLIEAAERRSSERREEESHRRLLLRDVLSSVTGGRLRLCEVPSDLPAALTWYGSDIPLTRTGGMQRLRRSVHDAALEAGLSGARADDLVTAVGEAGINAIVHTGEGSARIAIDCEQGITQVWVKDQGEGIAIENLPKATLQKGYTTAGTLGHGMKMMLQTADRVYLLTGAAGTTIVAEQERAAPVAHW